VNEIRKRFIDAPFGGENGSENGTDNVSSWLQEVARGGLSYASLVLLQYYMSLNKVIR
jgi:hypothetical protein